ncbi:unnamed protein product, partial [Mesorhabditis spiculigera]
MSRESSISKFPDSIPGFASPLSNASGIKTEIDEDDRKFVLTTSQSRKRAKASTASYQEVNWDQDGDYTPTSKKRAAAKDGRPRGRPKKGSTPSTTTSASKLRGRLSEDAISGVEQMHEEILRQQQAGIARLPISADSLHIPPGCVVLNPANELDKYLIKIREQFSEMCPFIISDAFFSAVRQEIRAEELKQIELKERLRVCTQNIDHLKQDMGVGLLKVRLQELGMAEVETPGELLNRSKQIVCYHKDVTQRCSTLESEVAAMESKLRTYLPYGDRLIDRMYNVDQTFFADPTHVDPYLELIQIACIESGCQLLVPRTEETSEQQSQQEPPAQSPGAQPAARRPRHRSRVTSKRAAAGAKSEETSEEMERQIQEIVQKALKVDSAAKEKEPGCPPMTVVEFSEVPEVASETTVVTTGTEGENGDVSINSEGDKPATPQN